VAEAEQVHPDHRTGEHQQHPHDHRATQLCSGFVEEGSDHRRCAPIAHPPVEVGGEGIAGRSHPEDPEPEQGHRGPHEVQQDQSPETTQPTVQGRELFEGEEHGPPPDGRGRQYTPSSPNFFASELAPMTRISPTSPLNRPTAVAKLSWPFWMPAVYTKVSKISPTSRFIEFSSRNMCSKPSSRKS